MKVTGWTYWEDSNYLNICDEHTRLACALTKDVPKIPNREECSKMTQEELSAVLKERRIAFDAALDNEELHKVNALMEEGCDAVIKELGEKGYHFTGNDHQNAEWGVPILDDKYILCVSQRTWGGIIAAAFPNEIDDTEGLGYIKWAWTTPEGEEDKVKHG